MDPWSVCQSGVPTNRAEERRLLHSTACLFGLRTDSARLRRQRPAEGQTLAPPKEKMLRVTFGLWEKLDRKNETTFSALHWKPRADGRVWKSEFVQW